MAGVPFNPLQASTPAPKQAITADPEARARFLASKAQAPNAKDMSDLQFALASHQHAYSDVPLIDYLGKLGFDRGDALYELRQDGDPYAAYLRSALAAPGTGESAEDAAKRQGGSLSDRRAGVHEGALRAVTQGATFGFGDEIVAAGAAALDPLVHGDDGSTFGERFTARQANESGLIENFREDEPAVAYGSEILGAVPTSMAAGGQIAGRGANGFQRLVTGAGVAGGQGAAYGAGATDGDLDARGRGALIGAGTGMAADAGLVGLSNLVRGMFRQHGYGQAVNDAVEAAPNASDIADQSHAGYRAAESAGVEITPQASTLLDQDFRQLLTDEGLTLPNGSLQEGTGRIKRVLGQLAHYGKAPMTVQQFQRLRESVADVAASPKPGQARIGKRMLDVFDQFAESLPDTAFNGHGGPDAMKAWAGAKDDWARSRRTKSLEDAWYDASMTPDGDFATRMRTAIGSVLKKHNKRGRGFSDEEVAAMERFVQGGGLADMMKALAQGGGIPSGVFGGAMVAGPGGAAAGWAAGAGANAGARLWSDNAARRAMQEITAEVATPGGLPRRATAQPLADLDALMLHSGASGGLNPTTGEQRDWLRELIFSGGR